MNYKIELQNYKFEKKKKNELIKKIKNKNVGFFGGGGKSSLKLIFEIKWEIIVVICMDLPINLSSP